MTLFLWILMCFLILAGGGYVIAFYPRQRANNRPVRVEVSTPDGNVDYHNDCLHPCIRKSKDCKYMMVQSPWYDFNDKIENPLFYISRDINKWDNALELVGTPETGYNSDPNLYIDDENIYALWREYDTPRCRDLGCITALFCRLSNDGGRTFSEPYLIVKNIVEDFSVDALMCPCLIKHSEIYLIYATWYQFKPSKKNLGVAIWEGTSLTSPDFKLKHLNNIEPVWTVDKWHQLSIFGRLYFFPIPHKYDLWHFDLFEYKNELYMISCEDKTDNIMLGVSEDYIHFKTYRIPLINAHYMENRVHYRQKYYKPTALVENDTLHLFYTSNDKDNYRQNVLWTVDIDLNKITC